VGRFISQDPLGFGAGINLYDYVGNDPGNAVDPLGLQDPAEYVEPASGLADLRGRFNQFKAGPQFKPGSKERLSYSRFLDTLGPIGLAKQGYQAWTGHDPVGGRRVPLLERLATGALAAIGAVCHIGGGAEEVPGGFRGPAAKGYDWEHIFENHAPWGGVAQQRTSGTIFEGLSASQIMARVKSAWRYRELVQTQVGGATGIIQQRYRGVDPLSGQVIEFWFNKTTGVVRSAYPVR
jgi:hypothetical protein